MVMGKIYLHLKVSIVVMWQIVTVKLGILVPGRHQILIGQGLRMVMTSRVTLLLRGIKLRPVSRMMRGPRELMRLIMEQRPGGGDIHTQGPVETWKHNVCGVIIGHELVKPEGNIHVNIRVNVASRTTTSLTPDKHFNLTEQ